MKRATRKWGIGIGLMFSFCLLLSCSGMGKPQTNKFILLSSTIGPIDAGIVGALEDAFEKDTGIRVRHVGSGTGAALDIARKGNVDLSWSTQNPWKRNLCKRDLERKESI